MKYKVENRGRNEEHIIETSDGEYSNRDNTFFCDANNYSVVEEINEDN